MTKFECSACLKEASGSRACIEGDLVCQVCLVEIFKIAIQDEAEYPAHWGNIKLDIDTCGRLLPEGILDSYRLAGREFATPAADRVYCRHTDPPRRLDPCNAFVGAWQKRKDSVRCGVCMWYTCLRCEESHSTSTAVGPRTTIQHDCSPEREKEIRLRPLRGMLRGKDYQICPNQDCKRVWSLHDGCNHMRCACKTHFCFICGRHVRDGRGHWRSKGGCPRWNFPGDKNAQYDDGDQWNDNGDWNVQAEQPPGAEDSDVEFNQAVAEGRAYLMTKDVQIQKRLSGLTAYYDHRHGGTLYFLTKQSLRMRPLEGLTPDQMPVIMIRPRPQDQGAFAMIAGALDHGLMRFFGLLHKIKEHPGDPA